MSDTRTLADTPRHPSTFPIAWMTATKLAAGPRYFEADEPWISAAWARGEAGAVSRMKRLREFHRGLQLHQNEFPDLRELFSNGWRLTFRKRMVAGVWDVQLRWMCVAEKEAGLEALKNSLK